MAATIVVLVLLIIITPRLIGKETELSSIPRVIVDYANNNTTVYVHSAFGDHRYSNITIYVENETMAWRNITSDVEVYMLSMKIPASVSTAFFLNVSAYDGDKGYEYNCSILIDIEEEMLEIYEEKTYYVSSPFRILMREMEK
jgi:hypothetical protein